MKKSFALLHAAIFLAGFTGIFGRLITLKAGLLVWYRLFFSFIILFLILLLTKKLKKYNLQDMARQGFGGLLLGLHWILFYSSIKYSNISVGVVCFCLTSFFTAILNPIINKVPFKWGELLLSCIALIGVGFIFNIDVSFQKGIIIGVISSLFASLYVLYNEKLVRNYELLNINCYQMMGGWVGISILLPFLLKMDNMHFYIPDPKNLMYLFLLSSFCTVLLYMLIANVLKSLNAFTINLSFNLEPIYSIIGAMFIYHENKQLTPTFYIGLALIILSVSLQMFKSMYKNRKLKKAF